MTEPKTSQPARAGTREWVGLSVLSLACVLYVMDLTVLHLAVPAMSADLRPTSTQLLWIIDIYGFLVAGSLITMGSLGDRIGRRRILLFGAAAFGVASVIASLSTSAEMLIATRALLGLAGATIAPSTLSLIRNMFLDPRQRSVAISVWITSFSIGGAIGPLLGGVVLEFFWWGAVFLLAVPVMVLLLLLGPRLLPEYRDEGAGLPDIASALLSLLAVLSVIFGLKQVAQDGVSALALAAIVLGAVLAVVFVRRQRRLDDPLIDLRLFRDRAFSASLAAYGLGVFVVFGGFLFLPQFLQLVVGLSPLDAGLWMLPWALAFVVGSQATPRIVRVVRPGYVMSAGLVIAAVGFAMFTRVDASVSFGTMLVGSVLFSLGTAPLFTLTNDLIIGSAPPERAGAAAGISETSAELGGALGIAAFGSLGVAVYRGAMAHGVPGAVPVPAARTARDTLGGAMEVAAGLPERLGGPLVDAARDAFTQGLHIAAGVSVAGALAIAALVLVMLRRAEMPSYDDEDEGEQPRDPSPVRIPDGVV